MAPVRLGARGGATAPAASGDAGPRPAGKREAPPAGSRAAPPTGRAAAPPAGSGAAPPTGGVAVSLAGGAAGSQFARMPGRGPCGADGPQIRSGAGPPFAAKPVLPPSDPPAGHACGVAEPPPSGEARSGIGAGQPSSRCFAEDCLSGFIACFSIRQQGERCGQRLDLALRGQQYGAANAGSL